MNSIQNVTVEQVMSVYSGRAGKCCCGCAGKHSYSSANRNAGTKHRGYEVTDDEVSDRSIALTLNKMKKNAAQVEDSCDMFSVELGSRLHIVYLLPGSCK